MRGLHLGLWSQLYALHPTGKVRQHNSKSANAIMLRCCMECSTLTPPLSSRMHRFSWVSWTTRKSPCIHHTAAPPSSPTQFTAAIHAAKWITCKHQLSPPTIEHRPGLYHTSGIVHHHDHGPSTGALPHIQHCPLSPGALNTSGLHHRTSPAWGFAHIQDFRIRCLGLYTHPGLEHRCHLGLYHTSRPAHHPLATSLPDG